MDMKILKCKNCGAPITHDAVKCEYCGVSFVLKEEILPVSKVDEVVRNVKQGIMTPNEARKQLGLCPVYDTDGRLITYLYDRICRDGMNKTKGDY